MLPMTALPASLRRGKGCRRCSLTAAHSPRVVAAALPALMAHYMEGTLRAMAAVVAQHSHLLRRRQEQGMNVSSVVAAG